MRGVKIKIARGLDDLMMVYAIRAAVFLAGQDCPYAEEFDGNDHCATHFLAFIDGEPAGCLRARFFAGFCKLERLAVLKRYRGSRAAVEIAMAGIEHARRKGYMQIYGHSREGADAFWAKFGARPLPGREKFSFSGYRYTEVLARFAMHEAMITTESGAMVILRPEGDWDRPGVLEMPRPSLPLQD